jgi:hypothetical protein
MLQYWRPLCSVVLLYSHVIFLSVYDLQHNSKIKYCTGSNTIYHTNLKEGDVKNVTHTQHNSYEMRKLDMQETWYSLITLNNATILEAQICEPLYAYTNFPARKTQLLRNRLWPLTIKPNKVTRSWSSSFQKFVTRYTNLYFYTNS